MTTITLVRHGETDWNLQRRIQGATDIPLNETGRLQAREAAAALADRVMAAAGRVQVVSSDLARAAETARIIATGLRLPEPRLCTDLRERRYGEAEGMSIEEYTSRYGADRDAITGSEPRVDLRTRALRALERITTTAQIEGSARTAEVIAVSHGGLIRELLSHASDGLRPSEGERIANGSLHTFRLERGDLALVSTSCVAA